MKLLPALLLLLARNAFPQGPALPPGFVLEPIGSGWFKPVALAFLDTGKLLVAEKEGQVWYVEDGVRKNLVLDITRQVLNSGDRGLLGMAVEPGFDTSGFLYLLAVCDPDLNGYDEEKEAYSRLVRFTAAFDASGQLLVDPASRLDLLGKTWPTGIPACNYGHAIGTLRFLSDGSLVLSAGDAGHADVVDVGGLDPDCFGAGKLDPVQDLGAFRAQSLSSYSGKILRIDPDTGMGLPDNPFFDGNPASIRSRIYAVGLRNPFRLAIVPGTGSREALFVSDVGWGAWEEIDLSFGGEDFGWPCFEGPDPEPSYQASDPQGFCSGAPPVAPSIAWHHYDQSRSPFTGQCASGLAVYSGTSYPPFYRGALFFQDFSAGWMRQARLDANLNVVSISTFATGLTSPVDLVAEPESGDLHMCCLGNDQVYRLRYVGGNGAPTAVALANPTFGPAPLQVQFDATSSGDPDGDPLSFLWDFGDGTSSSDPEPLHTYLGSTQNFVATLTATDTLGSTGEAEILISPDNSPPVIESVLPAPGALYTVGSPLALQATASDAEDDPALVPLSFTWHVDLHHDHHVHPDAFVVTGAQGAFVPDTLYDGTWYGVRIEVADSRGLVTSQSFEVYDVATVPKAHVAGSPDVTPRLGQRFLVTGHMEFPGNPPLGPTSLEFDWGDGTSDVFPYARHQVDVITAHDYLDVGSHTLTLTARAGTTSSEVQVPIVVQPLKPAVAVFTPLLAERWISWTTQQDVASAIVAATEAEGAEAQVFTYADQDELRAWMSGFLDDCVQDVLVLLDHAPAQVFAGEEDGSLVESWLERGNGVLWTGQPAFSDWIRPDGTTASTGIPPGSFNGSGKTAQVGQGTAADGVLDSAAPRIALGGGSMALRPIASRLPALGAHGAAAALRYDRLGRAWQVDELYASDADADSDALVIRHVSGGFFALFYGVANDAAPRASVLPQFLRSYVFDAGKVRPVAGPPRPLR